MKYLNFFEKFENGLNDLIERLNKHSIPIEDWGKGDAKSIRSLFNEIKEEDCILKEDENGYLIRLIEFVGIRIYYRDGDNTWLLKEDRQVFNDGRTRRREMPSSVSEKMKFDEDPVNAAVRGISEELGVDINRKQLIKRRDLNYDGGSMSYPGLKTRYKGHQYSCYFTANQFDINGYVERQEEKSTYFTWKKIR
jgi:hypothetical protein